MNSLVLRGYGAYDRIITRGYGTGWLGLLRLEVVRLVTTMTRTISRITLIRTQTKED
jgi:hypothetical protein